MVPGLGRGSAAAFAVEALAARIAKGLRVVGIPASGKTAALRAVGHKARPGFTRPCVPNGSSVSTASGHPCGARFRVRATNSRHDLPVAPDLPEQA
ncbi:MAG: hypothetical protein WBE80_12870, partial [Methylocella sp.]